MLMFFTFFRVPDAATMVTAFAIVAAGGTPGVNVALEPIELFCKSSVPPERDIRGAVAAPKANVPGAVVLMLPDI